MLTGPVTRRRSDLRILEEEVRAWELAEGTLARQGYVLTEAFEVRRQRALGRYIIALDRRQRRKV